MQLIKCAFCHSWWHMFIEEILKVLPEMLCDMQRLLNDFSKVVIQFVVDIPVVYTATRDV